MSSSRFSIASVVIGTIAFVVSCASAAKVEGPCARAVCRKWCAKVDPSGPSEGSGRLDIPADEEAMPVIECLLGLKGAKEPARFSGATRADVSHIAAPASIQVAALYYISFIYEKEWRHADAIEIVGPHGSNTEATIREAYAAYKGWSSRVREIGIAEARRRGMSPLKGTELHWYGQLADPTP